MGYVKNKLRGKSPYLLKPLRLGFSHNPNTLAVGPGLAFQNSCAGVIPISN